MTTTKTERARMTMAKFWLACRRILDSSPEGREEMNALARFYGIRHTTEDLARIKKYHREIREKVENLIATFGGQN